MPITTERVEEIDTELQRMRDYLVALAKEIDAAASYKGGPLHSSTVHALGSIAMLRRSLGQEQEHQRIGKEKQRRLQKLSEGEQLRST